MPDATVTELPKASTVKEVATNTVKKRGRKAGQPPKERMPIPKDAFGIKKLTTEKSKAELKRKREARGEDQQAIDEVVYNNWLEWVNAGKPMNWVDMPVYTWPVPAHFVEDAVFYLRRAITLYGRKMIWGEIRDMVQDDEDYHPGWKIIPFQVITRPKRPIQKDEEDNGVPASD